MDITKILINFLLDISKEVITVILSTGILSLIKKKKKNHSDSDPDNSSSSSSD
uniref:hypothetical protein n=1 Tax=Aeromonas sp. Ne-1 TaxID=1675689 RepID=UPI0015631FC5|nr:hypothetical protein [Aeromonas sp. Ne-1]